MWTAPFSGLYHAQRIESFKKIFVLLNGLSESDFVAFLPRLIVQRVDFFVFYHCLIPSSLRTTPRLICAHWTGAIFFLMDSYLPQLCRTAGNVRRQFRIILDSLPDISKIFKEFLEG